MIPRQKLAWLIYCQFERMLNLFQTFANINISNMRIPSENWFDIPSLNIFACWSVVMKLVFSNNRVSFLY